MVSPQRLHVDTARRLPLPAARVDRENTAKFLADNNIDADMELPPRRQVQLAGHVGAGAEVFPDDNGGTGLEYVEPAFPVPDDAVCVVVRGNSMYPRYFDGELIYYRSVPVPPEQALGRECVVRLVDGRMMVKIFRRGTKPGLFTLESWNAPAIEDVRIDYAAPVVFVDRR